MGWKVKGLECLNVVFNRNIVVWLVTVMWDMQVS